MMSRGMVRVMMVMIVMVMMMMNRQKMTICTVYGDVASTLTNELSTATI